MKFEIKNRWSGAAQFECELGVEFETEAFDVRLGAAVKLATKTGANLTGAYLAGAYLTGANLTGADLAGADLAGADLAGGIKLVGRRPIVAISPIGSRSDSVLFFLTDAGIKVRAGCFFGSLEEFRAAVAAEHGSGVHGREYGLACDMAELHAELWTPEGAAESVAEAA